MTSRILVIPDIHLPDTDWDRLGTVRDFAKFFKPDVIVQLGDFIDAKAWSRWPKDPDDRSPAQEWSAVEASVAAFHKMFGRWPTKFIFGNHDLRPILRATEVGLPRALVKSLDEIFTYPTWDWHIGPKPLIIDQVLFCHGDEFGGTAAQKAARVGMSLVQGHTHRASLTYLTTFQKQIWAAEAGCIINEEAAAFRYAARSASRSTQAFMTIADGLPHIYPLDAV